MALAAKRLAASLLLLAHLAAVLLWNLPDSALKERLGGWTPYYLLPTGQWQEWGMFAPDPSTATFTLEAVVHDSRGLLRRYSFPRMMDRSAGRGVWGYRHTKYAHNVGTPTGRANREFAARFVVRALGLRAADFPVDVQLAHDVWPTRSPEATADEPPGSPWPSVLETYRFPTLAEAMP